ncbi:radical SAM protein [Burkholderia diffusa]|uniref:radical SAM protein n=1 Tax=Burkholderia diffusa TaxID=488732 RepID=UPI00075DAD75|nr:radical SAM protein [Burkholderia diffusa]KVN06958.1 radical SAM protein [Burkholderia diffusa]
METMTDHAELILDGTKLAWHRERIEAWARGERIAPITIDMALTRACNYSCHFCYAMLQENARQSITREVIFDFLEDCATLGVKGVSFVSDGESTISPVFVDACQRGHALGLSMACGTNGFVLTRRKLEAVLPTLTYLRINISAGDRDRYGQIMGVKPEYFDRVCENIRTMMEIKKREQLPVTIGLQMVLMPQYADQVLPLARLGAELRPDYLVIKHCSDNEDGALGVNYLEYERLYTLLREAEAYSDDTYRVVVKWSKIQAAGMRSYQRCYGPPFMLQISGSGLVAPCGMLFNERYRKLHIGNICETRFRDLWASERYWEVMNYLASSGFNAQKMCGSLCLQHKANEFLDAYQKGEMTLPDVSGESAPAHINFV